MKANQKFREFKSDTKALNQVASVVFIIIALVIGSILIVSVADNSRTAQNNTSVAAVPGGTDIVGLWPLMFVIIPIIWVIKKFS